MVVSGYCLLPHNVLIFDAVEIDSLDYEIDSFDQEIDSLD